MLIRFGYDITIACTQPTPVVSMLTLREERAVDLQAPETFVSDPAVATRLYRDLFGNVCRRMMAPAGDLRISGDGVIRDHGARDPVDLNAPEIPVGDLPDECLVYLLGSRYCETDRLSQIAWDLFQHVPTGWPLVQAICDFTHQHVRFDYQRARSTRTAADVYEERVGVCRDFAHLAIAFCRCMNIPARYVNGYLSDIGVPPVVPMDFSAWIEVYLGDRWFLFDPRNNSPRIGRIVVARGRDAADVPLIHSFGPHLLQSFQVWTHEVPEEPAVVAPSYEHAQLQP